MGKCEVTRVTRHARTHAHAHARGELEARLETAPRALRWRSNHAQDMRDALDLTVVLCVCWKSRFRIKGTATDPYIMAYGFALRYP